MSGFTRAALLVSSLALAASCGGSSTPAPASATQAGTAGGGEHDGHAGAPDGEHAKHHAGQTADKGHAGHMGKGHVHKGPVGHRFDKAEEWVPRFEGPQRDAWQKPAHVISLMAITPGMAVADIGAGTGYFLPHLSRAVGATGTVRGLDIEADMVRYMKQRAVREKLANVDARKVQADDPQLAPASLDRVLIVDTWHHIADRVAYAKKLAAGLKPGGAVYVVDFTMESKVGPPKKHRLEADVIVAELGAAGLDVSMATEELPNQYVVVGRKGK